MEHIFSYVMFLVRQYLIEGVRIFFCWVCIKLLLKKLDFRDEFRGHSKTGKNKFCFTCIYICYFFYQHAGFLFPERTEGSEAIFTPAQTQPLQNYPASVRAEHHDRESQASTKPDEPLMRLVIASIMSCVLCVNYSSWILVYYYWHIQ